MNSNQKPLNYQEKPNVNGQSNSNHNSETNGKDFKASTKKEKIVQQGQQSQKFPPQKSQFLEDEVLDTNKIQDQISQEQQRSSQQIPNSQQQNEIPNIPPKEQTFEEIMHQIDEEHNSEDEGIQDYKIGGYHPIYIGEVINGRYVVIQKIGWGHFSTVWLAKDFKYDTYVALKVQKSAPHYLEAAFDEVEILQKVARMSKEAEWIKSLQHYYANEKKDSFNKDDCQVVQLLNSFVFKGPYGNHFCFVFEILGVNLLEVIKRYNYQGIPLHLCRKIAKQVLIGLDFLHRFCSVIHTDLKPENVLLQLTKEEIADIVDNGQITKNQLFSERLKAIRKHLGMQEVAEEIIKAAKETSKPQNKDKEVPKEKDQKQESEKESEEDEQDDNINIKELEQKLKQPNLTKQQKKNLRKKINRKKRKLLEPQEEGKEEKNEEPTEGVQQNKLDGNSVSPQIATNPQVTQGNLFSQVDTKLLDKNKLMRGPQLDDNFKLKIADLGNGCWIHHHFATEIQTRQYRSPEVIIGSKYNTTADVWSLACMLFEMLTGEFLFEPRKGPNFSKNDDHLAQIEERCKKFPQSFTQRGENSKKYFDKEGNLRRIPQLQYWPLKNILIERYRLKEKEAKAFHDFMMPMLHCLPEKRATPQQMLDHPWLKGPTTFYEYQQTEKEWTDFMKRKQISIDKAKLQGIEFRDSEIEDDQIFDEDINDADKDENSFADSDDEELEQEKGKIKGQARNINIKLVDRSFTDLGYIGFGDGIDFDALDNTGNWQFVNS